VPAHLSGSNSPGFQLAGLVHPALRTLLLPRELTNKKGLHVTLRLGAAVSAERVAALAHEGSLASHLRLRSYSLAAPRGRTAVNAADGAARPLPARRLHDIPARGDAARMAAEVAALGPQRRLATATALEVYCATAAQIPEVLREIGRLREITFRAVGEGTGKALDLDEFDAYYEHLFVWDPRKHDVVGAYRLGRIDDIRRRRGRGSLYIETLFELRDPFFALLGPALELGRSFVRPEYQRSFAPLLALWRAIGEYVGREPRYARLIGPVSISAEYDSVSRELLVRYARSHHFDPLLASLVRPKRPFHPVPALATLGAELGAVNGIDALSDLLAEREADRKGVPVLLRQYLKLGGRVLGFNVDPEFGDCVDFLTLVDLRRSPHAALARYMSPESLGRFRRAIRSRPQREIAA
jgi:putative hemolysin